MKTRSHEYALNCGQYVFMVNGQPTTAPADTIALCIDTVDGTLHKHGRPEGVRSWHLDNMSKLRQAGLADWAEKLVVIEGRFPLEDVNRMISTSGYARVFYEQLQAGKIQPLPLGAEMPTESPAEQSPGASA